MEFLTKYFQGAVHELKNVTWPTEKETFRIARITLVFMGVCAVLFFVTDSLLSNIFRVLFS